MPIKCESCKHCVSVEVPRFRFGKGIVTGDLQTVKVCKNELCTTEDIREQFPDRHGMPLDMAREICDREGNGIFVHFEPKTPSSGAAFQYGMKCPTCESPRPKLHPAMQYEGEVQPCMDPFHILPEQSDLVRITRDTPGPDWNECPDCTHSIAPGEEHTCQTPKDWRRQLNGHLREPQARKAAA